MLALTALPTIALVAVHLFAGRNLFRRLRGGAWLSFASGAAAAYVFLYVLPIINELSSELAFEDGRWPDGEWIFVTALLGTASFQVVEIYTRRVDDRTNPHGDPRFWVHIAAFGLYNLLVGALFVVKPYATALDALVYQSALILHFAAIDISLRERHPRTYDRMGRWFMAASVVAGWSIGHLGLTHPHATGLAFSFLAGGMILNVLKEEFSETESRNLSPFVGGVALFSVLFLAARMA